jgi:hypothetical protein
VLQYQVSLNQVAPFFSEIQKYVQIHVSVPVNFTIHYVSKVSTSKLQAYTRCYSGSTSGVRPTMLQAVSVKAMKPYGGVRVQLHVFLTSALRLASMVSFRA